MLSHGPYFCVFLEGGRNMLSWTPPSYLTHHSFCPTLAIHDARFIMEDLLSEDDKSVEKICEVMGIDLIFGEFKYCRFYIKLKKIYIPQYFSSSQIEEAILARIWKMYFYENGRPTVLLLTAGRYGKVQEYNRIFIETIMSYLN